MCWKETNQPGPAHGMCTYNCKGNPGACKTVATGSFCAYAPGVALCVEDCSPDGTGAFNPNKCHGRPDLGCFYSDDGWGCVPNCNSDADCGAGNYCNPKNGLCQSTPPTGLPTGAACTPNQGDCAGICQLVGGKVNVCANRCTLGAVPSCGWKGPGSVAPALCRMTTGWAQYGGKTNGTGDLAYCLQTCNCDADCTAPGARCWPLPDAIAAASGKKGVCQGSPPPQQLTCN